MQVRYIKNKELMTYNNLMNKVGSFFSRLEWISLFGDNAKVVGIFDNGNNLVGGVFFSKVNYGGFTVYRNLPFTPHVGPFFTVESQKNFTRISKIKEISNAISEYFNNDSRWNLIHISFQSEFIDLQPFYWNYYKISVSYTYRLNLGFDLVTLFENFSSERRKNIRKALKDGLYVKKIESENEIFQFKDIVYKSYKRQGILKKYELSEKIINKFILSENGFGMLVYENKIPKAGLMCLHDHHTAYYIIGGVNFDYLHSGAMALAMWEAIKYSKFIGLEVFDFEGSMVKSIEKFFRGFGGDLVPYYRVSKAPLLIELGLKFLKRQIF